MKVNPDDEYQDSRTHGSLVRALAMWRALQAANSHHHPQQLGFSLACTSESRAHRVAASLRRRRDCTLARVHRRESEPRTEWYVQGATQREIQSLANLEHLFTWLRRAALSHQVRLHDVSWTGSGGSTA